MDENSSFKDFFPHCSRFITSFTFISTLQLLLDGMDTLMDRYMEE